MLDVINEKEIVVLILDSQIQVIGEVEAVKDNWVVLRKPFMVMQGLDPQSGRMMILPIPILVSEINPVAYFTPKAFYKPSQELIKRYHEVSSGLKVATNIKPAS